MRAQKKPSKRRNMAIKGLKLYWRAKRNYLILTGKIRISKKYQKI
jgi:hypothetical protein